MIIFSLNAVLMTVAGIASLFLALIRAPIGYENEFGFYEGEEPPSPDRGGGGPPSFPGGNGTPSRQESVLVAS
jgi:hypothetical protein